MTLEDDVAGRIRDEARRTGKPIKDVVNEALRAGLDRRGEGPKPFRVDARNLGIRRGIDLDDVEGFLDRLEGPDRR